MSVWALRSMWGDDPYLPHLAELPKWGSDMDIIMCLDCGKKWTHGAFPDNGGAEAHAHEQSTGHAVRTGDREALEKQAAERRTG